MRSKRAAIVLLAASWWLAAPAPAQQAPAPESEASEESGNAEYRRRKLPADTFKPSEEISEDFPVPFPVDI